MFFARYEASSLGAAEIHTEHLLLGILREDKTIASSLRAFNLTDQIIRDKIAKHRPAPNAQISTSVDLPFSAELKSVIPLGAEEADRLGRRHIGTESLLLGLARQHSCFAARILGEAGLTPEKLRTLTGQIAAEAGLTQTTAPKEVPAADSEGFRDLTQLAGAGSLTPLIGREVELRRAVGILSRRTRNSVAFIADPGVGKTALVEGLAQCFASGGVAHFADHRILQTEAASLFPIKPGARAPKLVDDILRDLADGGQTFLCIEGLFDLALARFDWGVTEAWHVLSPFLATGRLQCIATGTPEGLQMTLAKAPDLARSFEIVMLAPPQPDEAVRILEGLKPKYEQFHGVSFAPGVIEMAVYASGRFLPQRSLPDRALDLLDEAAARVRTRREEEPADVIELRQEIRQHMHDFQAALGRDDLTECRVVSNLERAARQKLALLLRLRQDAAPRLVSPEDIEQVTADRVGAPVAAIRTILAQKGPADLKEAFAHLTERVPIERNPWLPLLAAYIARATDNEIDALIEAIRAARPDTEAL